MQLRSIIMAVWCIVFLSIGGCDSDFESKKPPKAVQGVIDLKEWDLENEPFIDLNGEWEFYWEQLLVSENFTDSDTSKPRQVINVPSRWNNLEINERKLSGIGYATYRLLVLHQPFSGSLALKISDIGTAYTVYVNGQKISSHKVVGKTHETTLPEYLPHVVDFFHEGKQLEIIIQVANFHYNQGGIWTAIKLGKESTIRDIRTRKLIFEIFLFGSIFMMALYHLGLFSLRRKDPSSLYFSIVCFIIALRTMLLGEYILQYIFPDLTWELKVRLSFITVWSAGPFFLLFIKTLFPRESKTWFFWLFLIPSAFFTIFSFFTPALVYSKTMTAFQLILMIGIVYVFCVLVLGIIRKREGAAILLAGCLFFFLSIINDVLYDNKVIITGYYVQIGIFIFIFSQAFLLSLRFSKAFANEEALSNNLEKQVSERTQQLESALQRISQKSDERKELIHILCHDLANPVASTLSALELLEGKPYLLKDFTIMLQRSSRNALDIITRVKGMMLLEHNDIQPELKPHNLLELVQTSLGILKFQLNNKSIEPQLRIDPALTVMVDRTLFVNSILNNLITNAIKFSFPHSTIEFYTGESDGKIRLTVKDFGVGIPEEILDILFETTAMTTREGTQGETGTGFGMPLIKKFVTEIGGELKIHSIEKLEGVSNHGTEVSIWLSAASL